VCSAKCLNRSKTHSKRPKKTIPNHTQIVGAGDAVAQLPADGSAMRVGPGLLVSSSSSSNDGNNFLVTARPGVLRQTKGGKLWVEARSRR